MIFLYICSKEISKDLFLIKDNLFISKQHKSASHYQLMNNCMFYYSEARFTKWRMPGVTLQLA